MGIKVLLVVEEIEGAELLGALYIAGCLQRAGHECKFVGTRGNRVEDEVRRFAPRVIATVESRGVHRARSRRRHVHRLRQPREAATHPAPNPTTPEISNLPAARDAGVDAPADAAADASSDAPTAIVRRDAGVDAKVDREQHRKGMPVPDNLLE